VLFIDEMTTYYRVDVIHRFSADRTKCKARKSCVLHLRLLPKIKVYKAIT